MCVCVLGCVSGVFLINHPASVELEELDGKCVFVVRL